MDTFDTVRHEFFEAYLERRPQIASLLGYTNRDTEMPSGHIRDRRKELEQDKEFLKKFLDISGSNLDFDSRMTRLLAIHKLNIWIFVDETLEHYVMNPNVTDEVSAALSSLFVRKGPERFYPLLARLEKIPAYINDFKTRVEKPVHLWTDMALEAVEGLHTFLPKISEAARKEIPNQDAEEVHNKTEQVREALHNYTIFLQEILPRASTPWAMGKEHFEELLRLRKLPYTGDEILNLGKMWLKEEKKRSEKLASLIAPGKPIEEVIIKVKKLHPLTFEEALLLYKKYVREARQFIIDHDILTLPEGEKLYVGETPEYDRYRLPLGEYYPPPVVGEERVGHFRVTPPETPDVLQEHNLPSIVNGAVHEAYPGHHVQLSASGRHPHRLRWPFFPGDTYSKVVSEGSEMVEGWALYCEEYMTKKGFCSTDEYMFMQSRLIIWRAVRVIVDVQLSRGEMSFDEAVSFMERETGMEHAAVVAEVKRYTLGPTYPLSYLLGKYMLRKMKKHVQNVLGPQFTDKFFHDTIIYEGTMPLAFLEDVFEHKTKSR